MEDGYANTTETLMIIDRLVSSFKIFAEQVNGIKESTIEEPLVEELVMTLKHEEDVPAAELKATDDQEEELKFNSYIINSIIDIFL